MKNFLVAIILLLVSTNLFSQTKITPPQEAFNVTISENSGFLFFNVEMKDDIYLLDDKTIFEVIKPKKIIFTDMVQADNPEIFKDQNVFFNNYKAGIPLDFFKSKKLKNKIKIKFTYQGCAGGGVICYPPMSKVFEVDISSGKFDRGQMVDEGSEFSQIANILRDKNFFFVLISFFSFGLLLSLTPCIFPMIPIVSSIIVSYSSDSMNSKKGFLLSLVYVVAMSFAYAIAGVIAGLFGSNVQIFLQNPLVIFIFSAIFVALALSMFGIFRMELPKSLQTKITKMTQGGKGIWGVAITGFLSALIIGPCVAAPLAGALMYIGQSGDALLGGSALFVMSIGMGIPLLIVGASAGKFLPKPGMWMNIVMNIFGFIMLGVALWFLSRAIPAHISLILWAILIFAVVLYLWIISKDFIQIKRVVLRLICAILFIYSALLFAGGINGGGSLINLSQNLSSQKLPKNGLIFTYVNSVDELEKIVKSSKKPIMVEFTATWCIVCTEFEDRTFSKKSVQDRLANFTLVKIDVTKNTKNHKELLRKFGLYGPPGIIFYKNKEELKNLQIVGFKNEKEFLTFLDRVGNER